MKGDIDRHETSIIVLLLFCDKLLTDMGMKDNDSQWLVSLDNLLKDTEKSE